MLLGEKIQWLCNNPQCHTGAPMSFTIGFSMKTAMGWTPKVDMFNRPLNADPNTRTTEYACCTCGMTYAKVEKGWHTSFYAVRDGEKELMMERDDTPEYLKSINS